MTGQRFGRVLDPSLAEESGSFAEQVLPHMPILTRLAHRIAPDASAEDIVQEALIRAWRHRNRFDANKGRFRDWLLAILANEARRAASRRPRHVGGVFVVHRDAPDNRIDLEHALKSLSRRQKQAVDLHYFVGLSVAETANLMKCSEGTVKSTLADARTRLRVLLAEGR